MTNNEQTGLDNEELVEAWQNLQDAHLTFESEATDSPMYSARLSDAMDATRKYYRALEKLEKRMKK